MLQCSFKLNDKPLSVFQCGGISVPAFSGLGAHVNRKSFACYPNLGPIPPGEYFIFDRQSHGLIGHFQDIYSGRSDWFALYANDKIIDDETYCDQIKRGSFRLHPKGLLGISQGCITIENKADYQRIHAALKASPTVAITGTTLRAYGRVLVE